MIETMLLLIRRDQFQAAAKAATPMEARAVVIETLTGTLFERASPAPTAMAAMLARVTKALVVAVGVFNERPPFITSPSNFRLPPSI